MYESEFKRNKIIIEKNEQTLIPKLNAIYNRKKWTYHIVTDAISWIIEVFALLYEYSKDIAKRAFNENPEDIREHRRSFKNK